MVQLVIEAPGRKSPGFLKRMRQATHIQAALKASQLTAEVMDELVAFLLPYVVEPADRQEATDLLWEASQEQIEEAMRGIGGGDPLSARESETA